MRAPRNKATTVVYLILRNTEGQILVMDRLRTGYRGGECHVPAGHIDAGETATQALVRETKEEAGIEPVNPRFVHASFRPKYDKAGDRVDYFFEATEYRGVVANTEPHKHANLRFVAPDQLPDNMTPHIRHAIGCIERGEPFSELGYNFLWANGYMNRPPKQKTKKKRAAPL